jgi:TBC1 domain family member 15
MSKRYSTISPNMNDIGAQSPSNEHVERMAGILLTYNFYEKELGVFASRVYRKAATLTKMLAQDTSRVCRICAHHSTWSCKATRR